MAAIKYTSIINSFVSQEGSAGFYTNYIYYSLLVVYADGTKEIVEGKKETLAPLLLFLRTSVDELQDIKQLLTSLPSDISKLSHKIDEKMNYVLDSLYPIPDIRGMREKDALRRLEECELVPGIIRSDIVSDKEGIVSSLKRNRTNFKHVDIGITHDIPAVDGLTKDVAIEVLEKAGFQANIKYVSAQENEQDIVLHYSRSNDSISLIDIEIGKISEENENQVDIIGIGNKLEENFDDWNAWDGINPEGKKAVRLRPSPEREYFGRCPKCGTQQRLSRHACWKCSIPFMYTE